MADEEPQDHTSWWESLEPVHDSPLHPSTFDDPVAWPSPVEWRADEPSPAEIVRRAFLDDIDPQDAGLWSAPAGGPPAGGEQAAGVAGGVAGAAAAGPSDVTFFADSALVEDGPAQAAAEAEAEAEAEAPALYAHHDVPAASTGWREAFALRSTETKVVAVLALVGVAVLGLLFAARQDPSTNRSVQSRSDYVAAGGPVDTPAVTTTSLTTVPATIDLRALAAAEQGTDPAADPAAQGGSAAAPGATGSAPTQSATPRAQGQAPAAAETPATETPAPQAPASDPDPPSSAPPTTTAPVATTRPPRPTIPTFTVPSISTPSSVPRPTIPPFTIPSR